MSNPQSTLSADSGHCRVPKTTSQASQHHTRGSLTLHRPPKNYSCHLALAMGPGHMRARHSALPHHPGEDKRPRLRAAIRLGSSELHISPTTLHNSGIWGQDKRGKPVDTPDIKP